MDRLLLEFQVLLQGVDRKLFTATSYWAVRRVAIPVARPSIIQVDSIR